jgi:predicted transcriptional regulator
MGDSRSLTVDVDDETMAIIARVAERRGVSSRHFAAEAIRRAAESDDDLDAFIQVGIDAISRGDVVPHEDVMTELDGMIEKHRARCR